MASIARMLVALCIWILGDIDRNKRSIKCDEMFILMKKGSITDQEMLDLPYKTGKLVN